MEAMPPEQWRYGSANDGSNASRAMGGMGPMHMEMMPPAAMGGMDAPMMEAMPPVAMAGMDAAMMASMPPEQWRYGC